MSTKPWGLHWFRRDLRVAGNPGLRANAKRFEGRVLGLFCFDAKFLGREDFSANRFAFFLKTLESLRDELRLQGGDLLVVDALPTEAFPLILSQVKTRPGLVTWCRDYEPFARTRDAHVKTMLETAGVETANFRDHMLLEPEEVVKAPGAFYQVYSPYARKWFKRLHEPEIRARVDAQARAGTYYDHAVDGRLEKIFQLKWDDVRTPGFALTDQYQEFVAANAKNVTVPIPKAGFVAAYRHLLEFADHVKAYLDARNVPAQLGTSRLSIYLKNGSLTVPQIIQALNLGDLEFVNGPGKASAGQYLKELAWREFYYQILYHRPDVERDAFRQRYRNVAWSHDKNLFTRWCEGTTGFPIVDAGMRQLNTTGWMHNRVRMIVSSFLTKDLRIDYRWGENYFMKLLLDGDLAPNNGGWQWAASTGCDPQPYFRIFNPWLQSKKFDPKGDYIRAHIPELRDVPARALHEPEADRGARYPRPCVDHALVRPAALAMFRGLKD